MADQAHVAEITLSCVRELLAKRGLKNTLAELDRESPRREGSISKRSELARELGIDKLMSNNKKSETPYGSMLEVMASHFRTNISPSDSNTSETSLSSTSSKSRKGASKRRGVPTTTTAESTITPTQTNTTATTTTTTDASPGLFASSSLVSSSSSSLSSSSTKGRGDIHSNSCNNTPPTSSRTRASKKRGTAPQHADVETEIEDLSMTMEDFDVSASVESRTTTTARSKARNKDGGTLLSASDVKKLHRALFPSSIPTWSESWKKQEFLFSNEPALEYGFVQHEGGSCGVLAAVNAIVIKYLMKLGKPTSTSRVTEDERQDALLKAMSEILWRAGANESARVVFQAHSNTVDPFSSLVEHVFTDKNELDMFLSKHLKRFQDPTSMGVINFVHSVVRSKKIKRLQEELDSPEVALIGQYCYCSQELVNLLLTGRGCSNLFDSDKHLDELVLHGVKTQSEIGMLSIHDHFGDAPVGEFMKSPKFPIWVVYNESHYSLLYSLSTSILSDRQQKFDVYYFDQLGKQDEEFRISVDPTDPKRTLVKKRLESNIDLCIRTRWANADVDWNGKIGGF